RQQQKAQRKGGLIPQRCEQRGAPPGYTKAQAQPLDSARRVGCRDGRPGRLANECQNGHCVEHCHCTSDQESAPVANLANRERTEQRTGRHAQELRGLQYAHASSQPRRRQDGRREREDGRIGRGHHTLKQAVDKDVPCLPRKHQRAQREPNAHKRADHHCLAPETVREDTPHGAANGMQDIGTHGDGARPHDRGRLALAELDQVQRKEWRDRCERRRADKLRQQKRTVVDLPSTTASGETGPEVRLANRRTKSGQVRSNPLARNKSTVLRTHAATLSIGATVRPISDNGLTQPLSADAFTGVSQYSRASRLWTPALRRKSRKPRARSVSLQTSNTPPVCASTCVPPPSSSWPSQASPTALPSR